MSGTFGERLAKLETACSKLEETMGGVIYAGRLQAEGGKVLVELCRNLDLRVTALEKAHAEELLKPEADWLDSLLRNDEPK